MPYKKFMKTIILGTSDDESFAPSTQQSAIQLMVLKIVGWSHNLSDVSTKINLNKLISTVVSSRRRGH